MSICPGCGRCSECGQPAPVLPYPYPQPVPYPYPQPVPYPYPYVPQPTYPPNPIWISQQSTSSGPG